MVPGTLPPCYVKLQACIALQPLSASSFKCLLLTDCLSAVSTSDLVLLQLADSNGCDDSDPIKQAKQSALEDDVDNVIVLLDKNLESTMSTKQALFSGGFLRSWALEWLQYGESAQARPSHFLSCIFCP